VQVADYLGDSSSCTMIQNAVRASLCAMHPETGSHSRCRLLMQLTHAPKLLQRAVLRHRHEFDNFQLVHLPVSLWPTALAEQITSADGVQTLSISDEFLASVVDHTALTAALGHALAQSAPVHRVVMLDMTITDATLMAFWHKLFPCCPQLQVVMVERPNVLAGRPSAAVHSDLSSETQAPSGGLSSWDVAELQQPSACNFLGPSGWRCVSSSCPELESRQAHTDEALVGNEGLVFDGMAGAQILSDLISGRQVSHHQVSQSARLLATTEHITLCDSSVAEKAQSIWTAGVAIAESFSMKQVARKLLLWFPRMLALRTLRLHSVLDDALARRLAPHLPSISGLCTLDLSRNMQLGAKGTGRIAAVMPLLSSLQVHAMISVCFKM
jgi:hypothetical protein